jgi:hypothetical protein
LVIQSFYTFTVVKLFKVSGSFSLKYKSFFRAFALLGVYAIHLVCFQTLMEAAPVHEVNNSFKPFFSHHKSTAQNNLPPSHPAVAYYTQLMKQGKDVRGLSEVLPAVNQLDAVVPTTPSVLSVIFRLYEISSGKLHLSADTFKLYRLLQVFLI